MDFIDFVKIKSKRELDNNLVDVLKREKERRAVMGFNPIDIPDYILSVEEISHLKRLEKEFLIGDKR